MTFSLSGDRITQTGTDDIRDIISAGISGVTSFGGDGTSDESDAVTILIDGRYLRVNGTLNINPWTTRLLFNNYTPAASSGLIEIFGTLNVNGERVVNVNGTDYYDYATHNWVTFMLERLTGGNIWSIEIENGATLNLTGGSIMSRFRMLARPGSIVNIKNAIIDAGYNFNLDSAHQPQFRIDTNDFNVDGLLLRRGWITWIKIPNTPPLGFEPVMCSGPFKFSSNTPDQDFNIRNYKTNFSNYQDVGLWQGSRPYFVNSFEGSNMIIGKNESNNSGNRGLVRCFQEVNTRLTDLSGSLLSNCVVGFTDSDGGVTTTYDDEGFSSSPWDHSTINDYFETVTNGVLSSDLSIFIAGLSVTDSMGGRVNDPDGAGVFGNWSYRGLNSANDDIFRFFIGSYTHIPVSTDIPLKGKFGRSPSTGDNVIEIQASLSEDTNITELDRSLVSSYTQATNLDQLYDWLKHLKISTLDNFKYLGQDTAFTTLQGAYLTVPFDNLVVNSSSNLDLNISTSTLTVNSLNSGAKFELFGFNNQNVSLNSPSDLPSAGFISSGSNFTLLSDGTYDLSGWIISGTLDFQLGGAATNATIILSPIITATLGVGVTRSAPQTTLTFTNIPTGAEGRVTVGSQTLLYEGNITDGDLLYYYSYIPNQVVKARFYLPGFVPQIRTISLTDTDQTIPLDTFSTDTSYI